MEGKHIPRSLDLDRDGLVFAPGETQRWQGDVRVAQHGEQVHRQLLPPYARSVAYRGRAVVCLVCRVPGTVLVLHWLHVPQQ